MNKLTSPASLPVFEYQGQLVADSRDVAAKLERGHNELMKSIRVYIRYLGEGEIAHSDFFIESTYITAQNKAAPNYLITQKGCDMIANKAPGKKGVLFTAAYVTAFHAMRDELARRRELRAIGKPIRRSLTDALRDSGEAERMHGHAYAIYTNLAYTLSLGKNARQLRQERGADRDVIAADLLTSAELEIYQRKESAITVLLDAGLRYDAIKTVLNGGKRI